MPERPLSLRQAAKIIGVHHTTLARAVARGEIKPVSSTPKGWKRYSRQDIEHYLLNKTFNGNNQINPADYHAVEMALSEIPKLARETTSADYAALTVLQPPDRAFRIFHDGLDSEVKWQDKELPQGRGVLGRLGSANSPLRMDNLSTHPHSYGFPDWHPKMKALLGVQVANERGLKANLYLANSPDHSGFTPEDEKQLVRLANFAKLAIDFARSHDQERQSRIDVQTAESRLRAAIDGSLVGVVIGSASSGAILGFSSEARRILDIELKIGLSLEEISNRVDFFNIDGSLIADDEIPLFAALQGSNGSAASEMFIQRGDGSRIPVLASSAAIKLPGGLIDSAIMVIQDLSEVYKAKEIKSDFLSMVTHDLRSPLSTIKGIISSSDMENGQNKDPYADLQSIDEEVDHMTELVANLLNMSRIESGTTGVDREICHLADILPDAVRRVSATRYGAGRAVNVKIPADLPKMYADPAQLGRVVDNMLSNAMKYTVGEVGISCAYVVASDAIRTEVIDSGEGVPEDLKSEIFDKFFRTRLEKTEGREGAGLGLAICKSVIGAHGGTIGVETNKDGGATFWFEIPRDRKH
jgi:signal transduction histidine kinase